MSEITQKQNKFAAVQRTMSTSYTTCILKYKSFKGFPSKEWYLKNDFVVYLGTIKKIPKSYSSDGIFWAFHVCQT